jgi:hypothetical protein
MKPPKVVPDITDNSKRKYFQGSYDGIDGSRIPIDVGAFEKKTGAIVRDLLIQMLSSYVVSIMN